MYEVRDAVNFIVLTCCLNSLSSTIHDMVVLDNEVKSRRLCDGATFAFLKLITGHLKLDNLFKEQMGTNIAPSLDQNQSKSFDSRESILFERGGMYMMYWAIISATISKLIYYNTLFTYLRLMEVWISMNPVFCMLDEFN